MWPSRLCLSSDLQECLFIQRRIFCNCSFRPLTMRHARQSWTEPGAVVPTPLPPTLCTCRRPSSPHQAKNLVTEDAGGERGAANGEEEQPGKESKSSTVLGLLLFQDPLHGASIHPSRPLACWCLACKNAPHFNAR